MPILQPGDCLMRKIIRQTDTLIIVFDQTQIGREMNPSLAEVMMLEKEVYCVCRTPDIATNAIVSP